MSKISKDGHLISYSRDLASLVKNRGKLLPKKIGLNNASVFNGFCAQHDKSLFSCIENEKFSGDAVQCLAIAYRTISRELYGKDAVSDTIEVLRDADKGKGQSDQLKHQAYIELVKQGAEAAQHEHKAIHQFLTNAIANDQPNVLKSLIIEFDGSLPFMFAGAWSPFTDLFDRGLQEGHANEVLEQVFFSSFAVDQRDQICISWKDIGGAPGEVISQQILCFPAEQQASVCLQFVMKHIENIFFDPNWFASLDNGQRVHLDALTADGTDPLGSVPSVPVKTDLEFKLPPARKFFFAR